MVELNISGSAEEAAQTGAMFVATLAEECLGGRFIIALSGGTTPRRLYQILALPPKGEGIAWDRWHILWGDERRVLTPVPSPNRRAVAVGRAAIFIHHGARGNRHDRFIAV